MNPSLKHRLISLILLGVEASWLYLLFRAAVAVVEVVTGGTVVGPPFPAPWVMLMLPASAFVWELGRGVVKRPLLRFAAWAAVGAAAIAGVQRLCPGVPLYLVLPMAVLLWGAGLRLVLGGVSVEAAIRELQLGILALLAVFAVSSGVQLDLPGAQVAAVICVGLGLLAAALANERGPSGTLGRRRWWAVLLVSAAAVGGIAALVVVLVTPGALETLGRAAGWVWGRVDALLAMIGNLLPDSGGGSGAAMPAPGSQGASSESMDGVLPAWLLRTVRMVFTVFVVVCTAAVVWLLSRRLLALGRRAVEGRGEVESLPGAFRLDLKRYARAIMARVRLLFGWRRAAGTTSAVASDPPEITSVREMYRRLLRRAARRGVARRGFDTPGEYESILAASLDGARADLSRLTAAYVAARYGAVAPSPDELQELTAAWRRLEHHF